MGNGEWGMENGERRMDGEFIVASLIPFITSHWSCAEWGMDNGEWRKQGLMEQ
jgi:hypothetical protein